jgi:pentapeptide MXKDX repeat protein
MKTWLTFVALLLVAAILTVGVIGCGAGTANPNNKMGNDKMEDHKMGSDKMDDHKMSGDKMGDSKKGDKMGGDKMDK